MPDRTPLLPSGLMVLTLLGAACRTMPVTPLAATPTPALAARMTAMARASMPPERWEALEALSVVQCLAPPGLGSGVVISPTRVLITAHQFNGLPVIGIERRWHPLLSVERPLPNADWAAVRLRTSLAATPAAFDLDRALEPGDELFIVGYWAAAAGPRPASLLPRSVVRVEVCEDPGIDSFAFDRVLCCSDPTMAAMTGLSGGPVVAWDDQRGWVVVGVFQGQWIVEDADGRVTDQTVIVQRVPAAILADS